MESIGTSGFTDASLHISVGARLSVLPLTSFQYVNSEFSLGCVQITCFAWRLGPKLAPSSAAAQGSCDAVHCHWFLPHS